VVRQRSAKPLFVGSIPTRASNPSSIKALTLTPVADAAYLYGPGELTDPCYGLFTFRLTDSTHQQDFFVAFMDHAILFSFLRGELPPASSNPYEYPYGVGLK
jgi:hypothetical protein